MSIRNKDGSSDDDNFLELVDALDDIDDTSNDAIDNATTISDGNGGRIELDNKPNPKPLPSTRTDLNQSKVIRVVLKKKPETVKRHIIIKLKDNPKK